MADADIERLALGLEAHRAAQASAFPDHGVSVMLDRPNTSRRPPEMSNTAPVEKAQSSEASQATIAASSSTRTKRPFGIFDSMKSMCCLRDLVEDRGLGRGRGHRVDGDVVAGEFLAERFRQRDQTGLRGRVVRRVRVAFLAGDRGDVDDAAVVLLDHRGHDRLAADEGAVEIDAQHLAPFLEIGFPHRLVDAGDAGIVDENVDLAEAP